MQMPRNVDILLLKVARLEIFIIGEIASSSSNKCSTKPNREVSSSGGVIDGSRFSGIISGLR